jgi:energy-coupling factor transporter ATP-binding protein EcfA2
MDVLHDFATVREAIEFSATLRLPRTVEEAARAAFVDEILAMLELAPLAGRMIGALGATGALSASERKRVSIGIELAANPAILFCDEPSTGLDARSAAVVVRVLKRIAASGRAVISTIHQPSGDVAALFDDVMILAPGGRTA